VGHPWFIIIAELNQNRDPLNRSVDTEINGNYSSTLFPIDESNTKDTTQLKDAYQGKNQAYIEELETGTEI
jgi:hypothetical protein